MSGDTQDRLKEIEAEVMLIPRDWMATFESDYPGKIKFCIAIAKAVKAMCAITPWLNEATFMDDVKRGTTLWVELGEPTWVPSESPSVPVEEGAAE